MRSKSVYGLLPEVSEEINERRIDRNRMQSHIRPVMKPHRLLAIMGIRAPRSIAEQRPQGSTLLPTWLSAGPTGHAMIMNPR